MSARREKEAAHKDLAAITFVRDRRSEFPFSDILAPVETRLRSAGWLEASGVQAALRTGVLEGRGIYVRL